MLDVPIELLCAALILLILWSAFFSSSETGMLSLNRYRLKHWSSNGHRGAKQALALLSRPDRLISVILIGNNLVNIGAATLASVIAVRLLPQHQDLALLLSTVLLTLVVLIFAEVTPKTLAQMYPERIAYPATYILKPLLILLYPLVWMVNGVVNGIMWLMRIKQAKISDALSLEELKVLVSDSTGRLPKKRQGMLLSVLELDNVKVNDIMIPRTDVVGIDLDDDIDSIAQKLKHSEYTRLPLFKGNLNKIIGVLHIRDATDFLWADEPTKVMLSKNSSDAYFVPENTPLHTQLFNFQAQKERMGLVVDEYGDIQGIVTLEDILEEIVGEFTTDFADTKEIHSQRDGSFVIDGSASIRDINKALKWDLPVDSAKTLNGLIINELETIPETQMSLKINHYTVEILQIKDNAVIAARMLPPKN